MPVSVTELKKQLMSKIDKKDFVQVDKVERYIDLVKSFRKINKIINKEGETLTTKNGSQQFLKAHQYRHCPILLKLLQKWLQHITKYQSKPLEL
ncbi:P27 family phage terminase small subunit [Bacillus sp. ISL-34]|uniref:P27 family phage terminase small subunit n=1 Tax=Bacillus sp. ISL-34 TaxID=2819121 RepID=UPI002852EF0F|nr:P27 family phage terminase small subunit [Bacillus sp. ISL-34]